MAPSFSEVAAVSRRREAPRGFFGHLLGLRCHQLKTLSGHLGFRVGSCIRKSLTPFFDVLVAKSLVLLMIIKFENMNLNRKPNRYDSLYA